RGAFSEVYQCQHPQDNTNYAAKIINAKFASQQDIQNIHREVRICRKLNHANIVRFYELTQGDNSYCMIFELVTNGELFQHISKRKIYTESDASIYFRQILKAVNHCHQNNIIHRDIKPKNLMISCSNGEETVKLIDFGLAIEVHPEIQEWHGFAGTLKYLSPEMIQNQPYGKPIDLWGCGAVLYALLVGYPPYWDDDIEVLFEDIIRGSISYRYHGWASISIEAKELVKKLLTVNMRTRLTAMQALQHPFISDWQKVCSKDHQQYTVNGLANFESRSRLQVSNLTILRLRTTLILY
ncbi:uncharacterized protein TRIADDRAFT_31065, partial [Trichoplax adhaerens]